MLFRISLRQSLRAPVRLALCFVLMALVCAFLTIGLNLQTSTEQNLTAIYDSYEVIAVPNFQAYVTKSGKLATGGNYAGYLPCQAENYDLSPILQATGVESIDVRDRFGAYVESNGFRRGFTYSGTKWLEYSDVIRFVYEGDDLLTLLSDRNGSSTTTQAVNLRVTWSAAGIPLSNYPAKAAFSFKKDVNIVLEPGVEYIAVLCFANMAYGATPDAIYIKTYSLGVSEYYKRVYSRNQEWEISYSESFNPIAKYTEDFWDTEQGQYFINEAKGSYYNLRSVNAVTTSDLTSALPFYKGNVWITDGRLFTDAEYTNGDKVCIVSSFLAKENGWKVGDRIDLSFYEAEYLYSDANASYVPRFANPVQDFFYDNTYEIVGLYGGLVTTGLTPKDTRYTEDVGVSWIDIYIPENAVENAPAPTISENNVSIRIETLSGQAFLAEMMDSGLMEKTDNWYQLGLKLYDQGISAMADGLTQLSDISNLVVILATVAAVLVTIVVVVYHIWRSKREIACLRSLGVRKRQVVAIVLFGLLLTSALGCAVGAACGHFASQWVAEEIVSAASDDLGDNSFTVGSNSDSSWTFLEDYEFQGTQRISAAVFSCGTALAAMMFFSILLVWAEGCKPPLLQLGRKE